ncbi:tRNA lysidine(34) synthetase TilS [Thalassotalea sp. PLHSN55]|uniref:tRNA lysidine(34) synthetase TilS n=1 Tax=Thalassotalea sp. PLHSN55 TaxID=3435888 RepID=UPI003F83EF50
MSLIESTLSSFCQQLAQQHIAIAYSGGVDSQVLLHALAKLKTQNKISHSISVYHINHGLSDNAHLWQMFAQQQSQKLGLPIKCIKVDIDLQSNQSLEALARDARYQALQSHVEASSAIVTGHHLDDQAETFILALKRGSGLKGLSAMKSHSLLGKHNLMRPLLTVSRGDIVEYAQEHQLEWIEDESNLDHRFDRNFLRHQVMPLLTERWPSMTRTISRAARHCQQGQTLLDELAQEDLNLCYHQASGEPSLVIEHLTTLSKARFNNLLRYFLSLHCDLMPSTEQLAQVHQQISVAPDKCPQIKVGDHWLRRYHGYLYLTTDFTDISQHNITLTDELKLLNLDQHLYVDLPDSLASLTLLKFSAGQVCQAENFVDVCLPQPEQKVTITFKHTNPKCLPHYRQQRRPVKKILQELNIPPWQRQRIPFLYYDDQLVAALGFFVCKEYIPQQVCDKLCIMWQPTS